MLDMEEFLVVRDLFNQGWSISGIARETGHSRVTVRKYIHSQVPPKPEKRSKRPSKLDDYKEYIDQRLQEYPLTAARIYREIQEQGFSGRGRVSRNKDHFTGLLSEILKQNSTQGAKASCVLKFNDPDVEHRSLAVYDSFLKGDKL
jgi:predicted transcriptional regulator